MEALMTNDQLGPVEEDEEMPQSQYYWNIARMTIMWSAVSFTTYLLHFQLKYLQGSIFINDYYCGLSDTMAVIFGGLIYSRLGLKNTYYFAYAMGLAGGIGILYLELTQI